MAKKKKRKAFVKPKGYSNKELSNHLRSLAAEIHDYSEEGEGVTRGEALAKLLWDKALGYTVKQIDDVGIETETHHEPASWALQMLFDRLEGKAPQAMEDTTDKITAAETVGTMAANRMNDFAKKVTKD